MDSVPRFSCVNFVVNLLLLSDMFQSEDFFSDANEFAKESADNFNVFSLSLRNFKLSSKRLSFSGMKSNSSFIGLSLSKLDLIKLDCLGRCSYDKLSFSKMDLS